MIEIKTYQPKIFNDLVERIWLLQNNEADVEIISPPDQYINLIFPLEKSVWEQNKIEIDSPQIEGVTLQSSLSKYPLGTKLLGIRFYPFGLISFANVSGKELLNQSILLTEITKQLPVLILEELQNGKLDTVESFLSQLFIPENYERTKLLRDFYRYFRWEHQAASIEEFCDDFGTNYTTLNRHFSKVVGISAKRFERLVKFRKALCRLTDTEESFTSIGFDSGYFDQSHFIREFKLFMNSSPKGYNALIRKADKDTNIINYNFSLY